MEHMSSLEKQHEESVIDIFTKRLEKIAHGLGKTPLGVALDGQDQNLGADYFLSEGTRFAIAEFKYQEGNIQKENKKPLRLKLCKQLAENQPRYEQHIACHLIAWSVPDADTTVLINCYCSEVCNAKIWGGSHGLKASPKTITRTKDKVFINDFLEGNAGLGFEEFESYIKWLLCLANDDNGSIELLFENPNTNVFGSLRFKSLHELKHWIDQNLHQPNPPSSGMTP